MKEVVDVKSTVRAIVGLNVPSLNLRRTWSKKNAIQKIPFDLLSQAIYEPGVEYLFKSGILYIDDMETKIALGLEEEGAESPSIVVVSTPKEVQSLLKETPLKDFREKVKQMSRDQVIELAYSAIELEVMDYQRCKILQDITDIDVFNTVVENQKDKN